MTGWAETSQQSAAVGIEEFGETIAYVNASAISRSISAIVHRQIASPLPESGRMMRPFFQVGVANNATTGISASELDTGKDHLTFPRRVGGTAEAFTIHRILFQDDGMLWLEVR